MKATHFREDADRLIPNLVQGHYPGMGAASGQMRASRRIGAVPGVGRLMTTVEDLARWDNFFLSPKKHELGILRLMLTPGWLENGQKIRYAAACFTALQGFEHAAA